MNTDHCMDCNMLLSSDSDLCPVCGFDNSLFVQQDMIFDGVLSSILEDDVIPAHYPGY